MYLVFRLLQISTIHSIIQRAMWQGVLPYRDKKEVFSINMAIYNIDNTSFIFCIIFVN